MDNSKQNDNINIITSDTGGYDNATNVIVPDGVTRIEDGEFFENTHLEQVIIPGSVREIGEEAFWGCNNLKNVFINEGVEIIEDCAFMRSGLAKIHLPETLKKLGDSVFFYCENLESIYIPSKLIEISSREFSCTKSLKSITVNPENKKFAEIDGVLFNKEKTVLIKYPACAPHSVYTVPDGVIIIAAEAFEFAKYLTSVIIPDSCKIIENEAFFWCETLVSINMPETIGLGDNVFKGCDLLTTPIANNKYRYYKKGGWYCKHNFECEALPSKDTVLCEISDFFTEDSLNILNDLITQCEEEDEEIISNYTSAENVFARCIVHSFSFACQYGILQNLIPVEEKNKQNENLRPIGKFEGFGEIVCWLDDMHLLSYNSDVGCYYALTCRTPGKTLLYSVLDAFSYWTSDKYKEVSDKYNIPNHLYITLALLVDAEQWLLGEWGTHEDIFNNNKETLFLMDLLNIVMFELNRRQNVVRSFHFWAYDFDFSDAYDNAKALDSHTHENGVIIEKTEYRECKTEKYPDLIMRTYIYADRKLSDNEYYFSPCTLKCPLNSMHIIAECLCKSESAIYVYTTSEYQFELFHKFDHEKIINGCLTENGLIVYSCGYSNINA